MTFVHPLLLGGLLLIGVPILIHLIMQQKPKHLYFPAFRFLLQKRRTNQRSLRLRHLLLLLSRILLIAALCLALARPKIFNERLNLAGGQAVAVAIVVDTSMSMGYKLGDKTRLEDARRRAGELLDGLPENSRIAIFDSALPASGEWQPTPALARERLEGLELKPANFPVADALAQAYRLLDRVDDEWERRGEPLPRFLYIFSDRTLASWDGSRVASLVELRDKGQAKVNGMFVDVGVEQPADLAIADLELPRQRVPANGRALIRVNVQATGKDFDTEVECRLDADKTAERKLVKLRARQGEWYVFERLGLAQGLHQAEVSLRSGDNLAFNNIRYATFLVTGPRKVLALADNPGDAAIWKLALGAGERAGEAAFDCEVASTDEATEKLGPAELGRYQAVCLLNVRAPADKLWEALYAFVKGGGGLAVLPGGDELDRASYNGPAGQRLLPGEFQKVIRRSPRDGGVSWDDDQYLSPVQDWFREWKQQGVAFTQVPPTALAYWDVKAGGRETARLLALYKDDMKRPALLERPFNRPEVRGRVLLFTTSFAGRRLDPNSDLQWNDYLPGFYMALAKKAVGYLSGDADDAHLNFLSGQTPTLLLAPEGRFPRYLLQGPGLSGQAGLVTRGEKQNELPLAQAAAPGNFTFTSEDGKWQTGFSLNVPPAESQLARVPVAQIEALLGPGSVLPAGHNVNFKDALQGHWSQPVELFPWLMILLLLLLATENLLSNRFYRSAPGQSEPEAEIPLLPPGYAARARDG